MVRGRCINIFLLLNLYFTIFPSIYWFYIGLLIYDTEGYHFCHEFQCRNICVGNIGKCVSQCRCHDVLLCLDCYVLSNYQAVVFPRWRLCQLPADKLSNCQAVAIKDGGRALRMRKPILSVGEAAILIAVELMQPCIAYLSYCLDMYLLPFCIT